MTILRRGVFLLLGAVVAMPYALAAGLLARSVATAGDNRAAALATAAVASAVALVPPFLGGTRELSIAAARALLGADLPDHAGPLEPETRLRAALWFGLHLVSGAIVGGLVVVAVPLALLAFTERLGLTRGALTGLDVGPLTADNRWGWALVGVLLLLLTLYATSGLGALARIMAPVLLGPSPAAREAAWAARERALAERNRLARELHDSVGHALTASTLQAGAARAVFDRDPEFARRALAAIEELGRTALDELDAVLGVLRDGEDPARTAAPTLADLDRLLTAEVSAEVTAVDVPGPASREAYRIVQESLTNAAKHGAGGVRVRVAMADDLVIMVKSRMTDKSEMSGAPAPDISSAGERDPCTLGGTAHAGALATTPGAAAAGAAAAGGRGLAGMRERVRLLGGELTAGPVGDEWHVTARLPVGRA